MTGRKPATAIASSEESRSSSISGCARKYSTFCTSSHRVGSAAAANAPYMTSSLTLRMAPCLFLRSRLDSRELALQDQLLLRHLVEKLRPDHVLAERIVRIDDDPQVLVAQLQHVLAGRRHVHPD